MVRVELAFCNVVFSRSFRSDGLTAKLLSLLRAMDLTQYMNVSKADVAGGVTVNRERTASIRAKQRLAEISPRV